MPAKETQHYILSKERFDSAEKAQAWLKGQDPPLKTELVEKEANWHATQFDSSECVEGSYATFDVADGVQGVLCQRRGGAEGRSLVLPLRSRLLELTPEAQGAGGQRTYHVVMSTEAPAMTDEYDGTPAEEVLLHGPENVDLSRMQPAGPIHVGQHWPRGEHVGVVENVALRDRKLEADARFSRSRRGQEVEQDVADKILRHVSIGYRVMRARPTQTPEGRKRWEVTRWQPYEMTMVSVPADYGAKVMRDGREHMYPVTLEGAEPATVEVPIGPKGKEPAKEVKTMKRVKDETGAAIEVEDTDPRPAHVEDDARSETERTRDRERAEIFRMADQYGFGSRAAEWVEKGLTADQVSTEILKLQRARTIQGRVAPPVVGDPLAAVRGSDRARYSYARALRQALAAAEDRGKFDGFEAEVHQELTRTLRPAAHGGYLVPLDLRSPEERWFYGQRALDARTLGKGPESVFESAGQLIELLRNYAAVAALGAQTLTGLTAPIGFPRQTGGSSVTWTGDNPGSDLADSDAALGIVNMIPKWLQVTTGYSRQLLITTSVDIEGMVRNDLAKAHGLAIDKAAIHGQGAAGQPTGIYLQVDVNSKAHGGVPTFATLVDQATLVAEDNADIGNLGWITTPGMAGKMKQTAEHSSATMADWVWKGTFRDGTMTGYPAKGTNQVSKTMTGTAGAETGGSDHGLIFGNWGDLIIGLFGALEIVVDVYTKKKQGLIEITSFQGADIVIRHAESFSRGTGATIV